MAGQDRDLGTSIGKLSLSTSTSATTSPVSKKNKKPVAESWEDDAVSSDSDNDRPSTPKESSGYPSAPPPTPSSPLSPAASYSSSDRIAGPGMFSSGYPDTWSASTTSRSRGDLRPEKTDAVAKRLIAGALGVKAPKRTEEQRAYDKAIKEKELKKRNAERDAAARAAEEAEKARAAAWEE